MFCSNCGSQIADGQKFCSQCGTPVAAAEVTTSTVEEKPAQEIKAMETEKAVEEIKTAEAEKKVEETKPVTAAPAAKAPNKAVEAAKSFIAKNKFMVILLAVAAVVILLLALILFSKPTLKLDKYVTVEFTGYDTVGKATYAIDYSAFDEAYADKIKINGSAVKKQLKEEMGELYSNDFYKAMLKDMERNPISVLKQEMNGSLDKSTELSNGDTVKFVWDIEKEELEDLFSCKIKCKDELEFKVEGLEIIGMFDPFEGVSVEYSGMAPTAYASINRDYTSEESGYLNYSLDKYDGLKNGDTVTMKVELNTSEDRFAEKFGKLPSPTTKTFTVEGLAAYVKDASEMPEDLMTKMKSQAEDIINSYAAKWDESVALEELTYLGNYFLNRKDDSYNDVRVYLVYRLNAKQTMNTVDQGTIVENKDSYYYVCFHNPMIDTDGSGAVDITYYDTPGTSFTVETGYLKSTVWWNEYFKYTYRGYESLEKLENDVVTKNLEYYNHQDDVTE